VEVEPVYVVESHARSRASSRRSFLATGFAFAFGGAVGSTGGFAAARATAGPEPTERDADLVRLQRLAIEAPVEELVENGWEYLAKLGSDYREDETLWHGFERIAARVTEPSSDARSRELALLAAAVLSRASDAATPARTRWMGLLREVR
jgi:hypothetical protein